jgi:uroporphyrinogen III methyltransferase/synthase
MAEVEKGTVYLVGAGPGDARLLTLRAAELLARADVVIHDGILNMAVLQHAQPVAEIIPAGKRGNDRLLAQEDINRLMIHKAREGKTVVRLKGGDPYVFGRGGEEASELARAGIPFEVVPGVSSFHAVPAAAGIPLTFRGCASAFTVVTGHEDPEKAEGSVDWRLMAQVHGTKVVLMGVERLAGIVASLKQNGLAPTTPAAVIHWGTTARQQTVVGTLEDIAQRAAEAGLTSPAIAVFGEVVQLRDKLNWFEGLPLFGRRVVVTRSREQSAELASRLYELGADVLEIPTVRIIPPTERTPMIEALAGLGEYDWIIFTSAHGVKAFFDALLAAFDDIRVLGNVRIAAVGPATAARLKELHLRVDAMPGQFIGRKIAAAISEKEGIENLRVLLARAQVANPELCRELEDLGAIVDDVAFYQTAAEPADPGGPEGVLQESGADWITFMSGSSVEHFHARINLPALIRKHPRIRLASIGPETSKALASLGVRVAVEPSSHTVSGVIDALVAASRKPGVQ